MADAAKVDALVQAALSSGEWKEERSKSSDGGIKIWYWLKRDKKVKIKNKKEFGAFLLKQEGEKAAAVAATATPPTPAPASDPAAPPTTALSNPPADSTNPAGPDAALIANMGVLGTDIETMSDAQELKNQIRLWEAKYKVLLDENKRLLLGNGIAGAPAAGLIVPSDLQLKYDALLRQNNALHADLEVRGHEVLRLTKAVEDLTEHKAKLEIQLGEAYTQASEGLEAKLKLQEKDDLAARAGDFVSEHIKEQNKFLSAQVAELTSLLHKIKEEDHFLARANAANEEAMPTAPMTPEERAKVAVHFHAIINTPARHVLCGRCRATLSRMITSEGIDDNMQTFSANIRPHSDVSVESLPANYKLWPPHTWSNPDPVVRPAAIANVTYPPAPPLVAAPTGHELSQTAVGTYGGFVVRTKVK